MTLFEQIKVIRSIFARPPQALTLVELNHHFFSSVQFVWYRFFTRISLFPAIESAL